MAARALDDRAGIGPGHGRRRDFGCARLELLRDEDSEANREDSEEQARVFPQCEI